MIEALPEYELYAIRYATRNAQRRDHFLGGDPHEAPMPMDYFVWAAVGPEQSVVIDVGFNKEVAQQRGRQHLRCPVEALRLVGVDPAKVEHVIVTHLHYDHAGNFEKFPNAQFHIQESEVHFATGRYMRYPRLAHGYEADDICQIVRLNFAQRVRQYEGDWELSPGIRVHRTGGHTAGLQFVSVHTARGWVVVASDASHFYENMESSRPFPTAFHIGEMYESFDRLIEIAPTPDHIVPGHDPLVMARYAAPSADLQDIVVRLDVVPN